MFIDFDDSEIELYDKLGSRIKIRKEIDNINEKIEVLKVKEDIEQIELGEEIAALNDRKKILSEEEKDIAESDEYKSIIGKFDTFKALKVKLKKLESKKGEIAENVYNKLKEEYTEDYKKNEMMLLKETERIQQLHTKVKKFSENIDALKEEEKLRFDLGEYTEDQYKNIVENIALNEKRAESVLYATSVLVDEFKSELK